MGKSKLVPNMKYSQLASDVQIEKTAAALRERGFTVIVAGNAAEARETVLGMLPKGKSIFTGSSATLDALGVPAEVDANFDSVRVRLSKMDYATQGGEMVKLGATPDVMLGSVHAITEQGNVLIASATGSQLAGYAASAGQLVWVVGSQKIVPSMDEAMARIEQYTLPLEDERALNAYGVNSGINKMLIVNREANPQRTTIVIVKENLGY